MKKKLELPEIDYKIVADLIVPVIGPFVQAGIWYGFSKIDKNAALMNKLIAVGEVIPAIDLGLPKGVTLAALYDTVDDTTELVLELVESIKEIPQSVEKAVRSFIEAARPDLDIIPDLPESQVNAIREAYNDCLNTYTNTMPALARNEITKNIFIGNCMAAKGVVYSIDQIKAIIGI